jgi:hypothetical protein
MSYKHKYLKYKNKYLDLLNQYGGMWNCSQCTFENHDLMNECEMCGLQKYRPIPVVADVGAAAAGVGAAAVAPVKTFYVYTTGMAESCDVSRAANTWNIFLRQMVLRNIHISFTNIIISHYDPFIENERKCVNFIRDFQPILQNDIAMSTPARRITSRFLQQPLDFEHLAHPHLVIDLAHIFDYLPNKNIIISGHYGESVSPEISNIKSLYPGYTGELQLQGKFSSQYLTECDLFRMDSEGNVITFIDRMFDLRYNTTAIHYTSDKIKEIFDLCENRSLEHLRQQAARSGKPSYVLLDQYDRIITPEISKSIIRKIINIIMNEDLTEAQLVQRVYDEELSRIIATIR